ncbi:Protein TOO MANY MOUTHS [Vitis vinifera]|uniref:Protein TOO MANY MOUTHS n=1 Tax=Vitis vinifera TaxID=29760 RepID=A0A438DVQ1_VITVI|nr:Protein TOO MANY MOUTHS [Vitis vinifera]
MCCSSWSLFLPLLLLVVPISCFPPCVSSSIGSYHVNKNKNNQAPPNNMDPSEAETLFNIMDSMSSDHTWRISFPNPCNSASSWPGIECKPGQNDKLLHVSRLDFGSPPNPSCKTTATFPSQVFTLPYLQSLFFFHCFTQTKTNISLPLLSHPSNASSLQQLSLRSNPALVGPIPSQISSLHSLQILTLSQNRLAGRIPVQIFSLKLFDSIEKLNSLVFMALSSNRLGGKFPQGLAKLQSLQYFIMDDNPMFIPLPEEFGKLMKLQELRVANSGYSGTIPTSFSHLTNLSTLSLQNNRLTGEIPEGFGSLSHIYHLNLSRNMLAGIVPFNSIFLKRLGRNLDLSANPGLCLSPSEAYGVKIGVNVCGTNRTVSTIQPFNKSEAPSGLCKSLFLLCFILCTSVLALHHISFSA